MYVKVKSGGCSGKTVVTGGKPKCVALLSDEIHAWRFLQKLNYKRRDGIQQTALTMQLFCTVTSSEKCCQHRSAEHIFTWKWKIQENKFSLLLALINLFPFSLMITCQTCVLFSPLRGAGVSFNCSLLYSESSFISCSLIGNLNDNDQTAATLSFYIHNDAAFNTAQPVHTTHKEYALTGRKSLRGQLFAKVHEVLVKKSYDSSAPSHQPHCQLTQHHLYVKAAQLNTQQHGWANYCHSYTTSPLTLQRDDCRTGHKLSWYEVWATAKLA